MNSISNFDLIRTHESPAKDDIDRFIRFFVIDHSWYKHLSDARAGTFFFYLLPPKTADENRAIISYVWSNSLSKSWDENYATEQERDVAMMDNLISEYSIPKEILEIGKIKLSRFIHGSFSNATEYFIESPEKKSFAELHQEITTDLRMHLDKLVGVVFLGLKT
jgi:hypothetical protein